ncbi:hypothetical protein HGO38_03760 [Rhizobium sp. CG5]|uniref:hypothetical protein n=1 Tax=Rhizobium sp. CG5 TaxID=2726076 RepID=UPI0020334D32|nr:hypothetical protein [Rhizobium sp. CG5]MCM2472593.1 hypothetical protein [Rhizobium sp. CG5]
MFKFFWSKARHRGDRISQGDDVWRRDPLSHPALRVMTERELADLPMEPRCFLAEPEREVPVKKNPPTHEQRAG